MLKLKVKVKQTEQQTLLFLKIHHNQDCDIPRLYIFANMAFFVDSFILI